MREKIEGRKSNNTHMHQEVIATGLGNNLVFPNEDTDVFIAKDWKIERQSGFRVEPGTRHETETNEDRVGREGMGMYGESGRSTDDRQRRPAGMVSSLLSVLHPDPTR